MKIDRCCCTCDRNIRKNDADGRIFCECLIDGHRIGYVESFESSCRRYALAKEYKPGGKWYEEDLKCGDIARVKDSNEEVVVLEERDANSVSTMDMFGNTVPYRKDMVEKVK